MPTANVLLKASIPGQPQEPVAWFRFYKAKAARVLHFAGASGALHPAAVPELLTNAVAWALSKPSPTGKADTLPRCQVASQRRSKAARASRSRRLPCRRIWNSNRCCRAAHRSADVSEFRRARADVGVEYLQYPYPAGLKILSEDKFLRAVYDKVPATSAESLSRPGRDHDPRRHRRRRDFRQTQDLHRRLEHRRGSLPTAAEGVGIESAVSAVLSGSQQRRRAGRRPGSSPCRLRPGGHAFRGK